MESSFSSLFLADIRRKFYLLIYSLPNSIGYTKLNTFFDCLSSTTEHILSSCSEIIILDHFYVHHSQYLTGLTFLCSKQSYEVGRTPCSCPWPSWRTQYIFRFLISKILLIIMLNSFLLKAQSIGSPCFLFCLFKSSAE